LKLPQPAFPMVVADGFSAVYPCHVPAREMRTHPIGTGPFKFVEFKPNERITCLSRIEKSQFLTDRNVTESVAGVELDDNNSLI
jgi:ABC-type transport system substrate-binding protein